MHELKKMFSDTDGDFWSTEDFCWRLFWIEVFFDKNSYEESEHDTGNFISYVNYILIVVWKKFSRRYFVVNVSLGR